MNINWLKMDVNILNDSKIKIIRKYPDGNSLFILWIGLLCLSMKSDITGIVYIAQGLPYTDEDLANEFDLDKKTVEMGLQLFQKLQMIDYTENGFIEIINFNKHQNLDKIEQIREQNRMRQIKHRKNKRLEITDNTVTRDDVTCHDEITQQIRLDIDKIRLDKTKDKEDDGTKVPVKKEKNDTYNPQINPPSLELFEQYCIFKKHDIDIEHCYSHYTQNGWKQASGNKIVDWRYVPSTWKKMSQNYKKPIYDTRHKNAINPAADQMELLKNKYFIESKKDE